ncbi:VgrG-related protein [Streptomyces sp. NPDC051014]|uniref:VgrG-related protein n=1 Tax=Streptomyces sp. NPDC051014 TaxID=3155751 RepID=UPI00340EF428
MSVPEEPPYPLAAVRVGRTTAQALDDDLQRQIQRAVVDYRVNMPSMVEVTFADGGADILDRAGIAFGSRIEVWTQASDDGQAALVGSGEVVAIEGDYSHDSLLTVVRAYDLGHRLQRVSRTRTFMNRTDSEIAEQVAQDAGLTIGMVVATRTSHVHLGQMNQTDWEFLAWRCREIGYTFGVDEDGFFFRPVTAATGAPVELRLFQNLRRFSPRVTAGNLASKVEMRVWDPLAARVVSAQADTKGELADLSGATVSGTLSSVSGTAVPPAPASSDPALGPAPTTNSRIVTSMAPASGSAIDAASQEALQGPARRLAGSFAEAQATAWGDPRIQAGTGVRVSGVTDPFTGTWTVTAARHVFDLLENGYRTHLQLGNPEDRTLLGLAANTGAPHDAPRVQGLVCGVVTNVNDPNAKGRVKVVLPWLAPDHETDWAPVVQPAGGKRAGSLLLPEVGDQVLLGFELGDPRRPYVVGGVLSNASAYTLGGPAVEATGETADVVRRGFVSPSGNMLAFHDKVPPGADQPPTESAFVLGTADGTLGIAVDQVAGTFTLTCAPKAPNSKAAAGTLNITCGDGGTVNITAGSGGKLNIDGGSDLSMRAQSSITIESTGSVAIKGSKIELN